MVNLHVKLMFLLVSINTLLCANYISGEKNMDYMVELMKEEIESGVSTSCDGGEGVNIEIDQHYYEISSDIFRKKLEKKGFQFLNKKEFTQKVSKIFNIELQEDIRVFDISDISFRFEEEFPSAQSEGGIGLKVFDRKHGYLTKIYRLPEIFDYQQYTQLIELENNNIEANMEDDCNIYLWKDFYKEVNINQYIDNEVENIISLNNYLFYGKGNIDKLFNQHHYFLSHLVLSNHYYLDSKLLEKVLDDVIDNSIADFRGLLWRYNTNKELLINKRVFKLILSKPKEKQEKFLQQIQIEKSTLNKKDQELLETFLKTSIRK